MKPKNTICLWFDKDAHEAARFYATLEHNFRRICKSDSGGTTAQHSRERTRLHAKPMSTRDPPCSGLRVL